MATGRIGTTPVLQVRWSKAPTNGTTSLSGLDDNSVSLVYSVGYEAVYRNGVLLSRGNDYTATNGTTVTLIDATITGDIIEIFANQTVPLSDTFSQTVADGRFIKNTLTTTTGDIIYASGANTPARLGIGSSAQVLTVSGGVPAWTTPAAGGGLTLINTGGTALSGASVSVSSIPGTYKNLHIYIEDCYPAAAGANGAIRFNTDTGSNYSGGGIRQEGSGGSATPTLSGNNAADRIYVIESMADSDNNNFAWFVIPNYASSVVRKVLGGNTCFNDGTYTWNKSNFGIWYATPAAITSVQIVTSSTWSGGTVYVYGEN